MFLSGFREGFLRKKDPFKKKIWKRRWFVLTADKLVFYAENGELRGEITMKNVLKVENWEPYEDEKDERTNYQYCFEIEATEEETKKGKKETRAYILQADDITTRDKWIYYLDIVAAVNFYANNPKLNESRSAFVKQCSIILQSSLSYLEHSVNFSRNTFLRGAEAKVFEVNDQFAPQLFQLLEAGMRYVVQRGEENQVMVSNKAKLFEEFSARVFKLWEYMAQLDGVNPEVIRHIVVFATDCIRGTRELEKMQIIASAVKTEDNTPIGSPRDQTVSPRATVNWKGRPRSVAYSVSPHALDTYLKEGDSMAAGRESEVGSQRATSQHAYESRKTYTRKSKSDIISPQTNLDPGNSTSFYLTTDTSGSNSNGTSMEEASVINERTSSTSPVKENNDAQSHHDTIFRLDLAEQIFNSLVENNPYGGSNNNNNSDGTTIVPRKKRSFIAKFEKKPDPDPNLQIDDCVRELTEMEFDAVKEQNLSSHNNSSASGWKSYNPTEATRKYANSISSRSTVLFYNPNDVIVVSNLTTHPEQQK